MSWIVGSLTGSMGDKIFDSALEHRNVVLDPPQGPVAVEAQDPPHLPPPMAVIHVLGRLLPTDRAHTALLFDQPEDRLVIDPVAKAEQEVLLTPGLLGYVLFDDLVVAGLAVRPEPGPGASISRKLSCRDVFSTAGTPGHVPASFGASLRSCEGALGGACSLR